MNVVQKIKNKIENQSVECQSCHNGRVPFNPLKKRQTVTCDSCGISVLVQRGVC